MPDDLRAVSRDHLLRRLSAPRRIDCPYRLIAVTAEPGFDIGGWLPADVVTHFTR